MEKPITCGTVHNRDGEIVRKPVKTIQPETKVVRFDIEKALPVPDDLDQRVGLVEIYDQSPTNPQTALWGA